MKKPAAPRRSSQPSAVLPPLDTVDTALLVAMQRDARTPVARLADTVGLSTPACYRRIGELRKRRTIEREIAVVAPRTMGWSLQMLILVSLAREDGGIVEQVSRKLQRSPRVIDAWYVTGDHDYVLRVIARDMEDYDDWASDFLQKDPAIKNVKTLATLRTLKLHGPVPTAHDSRSGDSGGSP
jgi:Lrp/AsnC family transcriptional regulator, leucine-responsive regulatory protein